MFLNATTALVSSKLHLVPYESHHVPTYHQWMQDEAIREATASEELTLEEEHAMQRSWRDDGDKLTFILTLPTSDGAINDAPTQLVGDVNLFIAEDEDDAGVFGGEVELMIATKEMQGNGYGKAALLLFLWYVLRRKDDIGVSYLRVKIGKENARSIRLFESVGFVKMSETPSYFGEFELRRKNIELTEVERLMREAGVEGEKEVVYKVSA